MRWSGVDIHEWWRNEQFWVISGVSAHLFAIFQGLFKMLAGINTNFTETSKACDIKDFENYMHSSGLLFSFSQPHLRSSTLSVLLQELQK
jgi:hypothetical protein